MPTWSSYRVSNLLRMGAKLIESSYVIQSQNLRELSISINKRDTYRKPNGKKVFLWHNFETYVNVLPEHIIEIEKTKLVESNDWYVSHRETYEQKYTVRSLSEAGKEYALQEYFRKRFNK